MTVGTFLRYLIGKRQAILDIASCPSAIGVGILFVLSAGLARDYDGEDLLAEPWHLLIPVAASLATSFVLFLLTFLKVMRRDPQRPRFSSAYRAFLGLYWMTAPLAWLYAIPYERFLSAPQAVEANLWTLGLVAAWRVALMIRVVSVLMGYRVLQAVVLVLFFADVVALTALEFMPLPIVSFMGGVRLSESDRVIYNVTCMIRCLGWLSLPIWIIGTLIVLVRAKPAWQHWSASVEPALRANRSIWVLGVVSVVVWAVVLPFTQPEQQLRRAVEQALRGSRLKDGLDLMLSHDRHDFPPHWDPPPRIGYADQNPPLLDIAELVAEQSDSWVRAAYVQKVRLALGERYYHYRDARVVMRRVRLAVRFGIAADLDEYTLSDMLHAIDSGTDVTDIERSETKAIVEDLLREQVRKR